MSGAAIYTATADERRLAGEWHGGGGSMLYAVASTGGLSRGSESFRGGRTDEEWSADLLAALLDEVREVVELAGRMTADDGVDRQVAEDWADTLAELYGRRRMVDEECHRCGAETGETVTAADAERVAYCSPCRGAMVLPCDCGGTYGPTVSSAMGDAPVKWCADCGRVCAYWDDDDLVDPDAEVGR